MAISELKIVIYTKQGRDNIQEYQGNS